MTRAGSPNRDQTTDVEMPTRAAGKSQFEHKDGDPNLARILLLVLNFSQPQKLQDHP